MILDPWPHIVIDDFLSKEDLAMFQQKAIEFNELVVLPWIEKNGSSKGRYYYKFETDPLEKYNILDYFAQFEHTRPYKDLGILPQLIKTPDGRAIDTDIHEDAPHKIFTIVIYISPEENTGTQVYDSNKNHIGEIEWKLNRALMFCPLTGITWHSYGSTTDRYTLMYNLVNK